MGGGWLPLQQSDDRKLESDGWQRVRLAPRCFHERPSESTQSRCSLGVKWGYGRGGEE